MACTRASTWCRRARTSAVTVTTSRVRPGSAGPTAARSAAYAAASRGTPPPSATSESTAQARQSSSSAGTPPDGLAPSASLVRESRVPTTARSGEGSASTSRRRTPPWVAASA